MNHIEAATLRAALPKIEPSVNDPETWVLGTLIAYPECLTGFCHQAGLLGFLLTEDFYEERHQWIYQAALDLAERDIRPGIDAVGAELLIRPAKGGKFPDYNQLVAIGGKGYLFELVNQATAPISGVDENGFTFANEAPYQGYYGFAKMVVDRASERQAKTLLSKIALAHAAHDMATVERLQMELDQTMHRTSKDGQGLTLDNGDSLAERLREWHEHPAEVRGYRTGMEYLDRYLGGLQQNELVILAGYTGSGKSTIAMQFALTFCEQGPGLIIPTEMSIDQWRLRLLAFELGTDDETIRKGQYGDLDRMLQGNTYISELPIQWFKAMSPTPAQILTSVRNLKRNGLIEWVIVDGLHDIKADGEGIYEKTNAAIDCLHEIANLGLVVVATAHLNRGATEEPNIRDLLGSARIEQCATRILTLYRPGNLMESGEIKQTPGGISPNMAQIRLAKSRFSRAGKIVKLYFGKRDGRHAFHPVED